MYITWITKFDEPFKYNLLINTISVQRMYSVEKGISRTFQLASRLAASVSDNSHIWCPANQLYDCGEKQTFFISNKCNSPRNAVSSLT